MDHAGVDRPLRVVRMPKAFGEIAMLRRVELGRRCVARGGCRKRLGLCATRTSSGRGLRYLARTAGL
jgi:hypothetical protein